MKHVRTPLTKKQLIVHVVASYARVGFSKVKISPVIYAAGADEEYPWHRTSKTVPCSGACNMYSSVGWDYVGFRDSLRLLIWFWREVRWNNRDITVLGRMLCSLG